MGHKDKKHPARSRHGLPLSAIMLLVLSFGALSSCDSGHADTARAYVPPTRIVYCNANELYTAYEENEIAADAKYLNNNISVTGFVSEIGRDKNDMPYVELYATGSGLFDVRCYLSADQVSYAAGLKKADKVTLLGQGNGFQMRSVQLRDCIFR